MSKIIQLSKDMINFIGSGEIIQNVKSYVKETLENSLDANAGEVIVQVIVS